MRLVHILPGYCDKCGGSIVNTMKGVECEDCGNTTFKKGS
jgi:exosome complex RNA-binding protein Csl4